MGMFARVVSSTLLRTTMGGGSGNGHLGGTSSPGPSGSGTGNVDGHSSALSALSPLDTPSPDHEEGRSSSFHGGGGAHGTAGNAGEDGKRVGRGERRVMPARLRRVSSLLAGSIEEEIAFAAAREESSSAIPGSAVVLLTTKDRTDCEPIVLGLDGSTITQGLRGEEIQTPDYRTRDDTEVMGKTRSMRSEEDTSDAAFERRHRKADNLEKRLRKWEKENLKKDRQRIVDRIDQLCAADVRVLAPILAAREKSDVRSTIEEKETEEQERDLSSEAELIKLEGLRDDLVKQHKAVLRRYDALLTVPLEENHQPSTVIGKRKASSAAVHDASDKPRRVISVSGAFARKPASAAATPPPSGASTSLKSSASMSAIPDESERKPNTKYSARDIKAHRLSPQDRSPRPFLDEDGKVRAENTYANIHARTCGGRFAPKAALGAAPATGPRSRINTKTGRPKSQQGMPRSARRAVSAASSTGTTTAKSEAPTPLTAEVPVKRGPGRPRKDGTSGPPKSSAATSTGRPRGRPPRQSLNAADPASGANEDTPRTRRFKLTFNRTKSDNSVENSYDSSAATATGVVPKMEDEDEEQVIVQQDADGDHEMDSEGEADAALSTSTTPARSALTLEQAQALFAQALADGDGDEDAKDEADAAAFIFPAAK